MKYEDFISDLNAAKISGREFARLLRLNQNTISSYKKKGNVPSHLAVIGTLMKILTEQGIPFQETIKTLDIEPNAARGKSISNPSK